MECFPHRHSFFFAGDNGPMCVYLSLPLPLSLYIFVVVSWNRGTPKSSILMGISIINQPFWGSPIYGNHHMDWNGLKLKFDGFENGFLKHQWTIGHESWMLRLVDEKNLGDAAGMTGSFSDHIHDSMIFFGCQLAHAISRRISRQLLPESPILLTKALLTQSKPWNSDI